MGKTIQSGRWTNGRWFRAASLVIWMIMVSGCSMIDGSGIITAGEAETPAIQIMGGQDGKLLPGETAPSSRPSSNAGKGTAAPGENTGPRGAASPGTDGNGLNVPARGNEPDNPYAKQTGNDPGSDPVTSPLVCEIKGEVVKPGVYQLSDGDRVNDLLRKAGGITANGSLTYLNLARRLADGESVYVPDAAMAEADFIKIQEAGQAVTPIVGGIKSTRGGDNPSGAAPAGNGAVGDGKINVNQASLKELETIPGVGPVTAGNIISYREDNGPFQTLEDIKNVSRIGDKTFEKLKDFIKIQ